MSDPLDLVRELAPAAEHQPELIERVRNDLMATINETAPHHNSPPANPPKGRRVRRRWMIPAAAAIVLTTAAAAWALTRTSADSTTLQCPDNAIIDAVTGDPVTDCSNEWRRSNGTEPPDMVAYDNGNGGVTVLAATQSVPEGFVELEPGPFQNTDLIQLEAALDDAGSGLASSCYDEPTAHDIARHELDRLGLASWTVAVDETRPPDGDSRCAYFVVDPSIQQVQLIGIEQATPGSNPYQPYAAALADQLEATCMTLDEAGLLARSLAAETTIVIDGTRIDFTEQAGVLIVHDVDDPTADCTRSIVNVGGRVEVTLRGPTS